MEEAEEELGRAMTEERVTEEEEKEREAEVEVVAALAGRMCTHRM